MKVYKWIFLMLVAGVFAACSDDSEEELVGNWKNMGQYDGNPKGNAASFMLKLDDGKEYGYVCCGHNGKICRNDVYQYDCSADRWTSQTDFPGKARTQAVGFAVGGKGYVGTGWDTKEDVMKDFWEFDPTRNTEVRPGMWIEGVWTEGEWTEGVWTQVAPLPNIAEERHSAIAFTLNVGGKDYGYVGTGNTEGKDRNLLKNFWRFDPDGQTVVETEEGPKAMKGKWEEVKGNTGYKRYGATAFVIENKAYICVGYNSISNSYARDLLVFNPNASDIGDDKIWSKKREMYDAEPDEDFDDDYGDLARAFAVSFTMPGGDDGKMKGYIAVGSGKSSVWEYDPLTDLWVKRTTHVSHISSITKGGATAFSFLEAVHPTKNTVGRSFVCLGLNGAIPFDDNREFFPTEEDNVRDDL